MILISFINKTIFLQTLFDYTTKPILGYFQLKTQTTYVTACDVLNITPPAFLINFLQNGKHV